jgi:hypothetical protein
MVISTQGWPPIQFKYQNFKDTAMEDSILYKSFVGVEHWLQLIAKCMRLQILAKRTAETINRENIIFEDDIEIRIAAIIAWRDQYAVDQNKLLQQRLELLTK